MNTDTTARTSEDCALLYALFDKWTDSLKTESQEETDLRKDFAKVWGVTDNSPLALMFSAFCGGIGEGLDLAEALRGDKTDEEQQTG